MIADHIFAWAAKQPRRIAFWHDGDPVSYGDFARSILLVRARLASLGCFGPGVALLLTHDMAEFWVTSLGLRSLGLTTLVPPTTRTISDLSLPDVRCAVVAGKATPNGFEEECRLRGFPIIRLEGLLETVEGPATPHQPAGGHILLTSGTTGRHKMLLIDADDEDAYHAARRDVLGIDEHTVFHVFNCGAWTGAGYKTAASVWPVGGAVVMQQAPPVYEALRTPGTHAVLVPSTLADILAAPAGAFPRQEHMQLSLTGGTVTPRRVEEARRRISPLVYNRLSSTEASIFGFTRLESPEDQRWHRPVPGRVVEIVDAEDRPLPAGTPGRLRVSTAGGPCQYLGNPEATAHFFRSGFFYSGDLAVAREDGRFALQGRITDVINVNGQKASPGPIEERLQAELGLSGACLFSTFDDQGEERVHLVFEADMPVSREALVSAFQSACRDAGIHGDFNASVRLVDKLPRTPTGKIIRRLVIEASGADDEVATPGRLSGPGGDGTIPQ